MFSLTQIQDTWSLTKKSSDLCQLRVQTVNAMSSRVTGKRGPFLKPSHATHTISARTPTACTVLMKLGAWQIKNGGSAFVGKLCLEERRSTSKRETSSQRLLQTACIQHLTGPRRTALPHVVVAAVGSSLCSLDSGCSSAGSMGSAEHQRLQVCSKPDTRA